MIDLLFTTHNRLEYTKASFAALRANTNWDSVDVLHITDDSSRDGTWEWLCNELDTVPANRYVQQDTFGGPVAAMNYALDNSDAAVIAKVDNDCIVCPGWLDAMTAVLDANPTIDALGMEPSFGEAVRALDVQRTARPAPFIGGIGLIRTRVFARHRPKQDKRFFGWTQFQRLHVGAAWITPDLPVFLLDHIPVEPWASLAQRYIEQGWSRHWERYYEAGPEYYDWWLRERVAVA